MEHVLLLKEIQRRNLEEQNLGRLKAYMTFSGRQHLSYTVD